MPRPPDNPDVAASKTLAYILRHGAEKEGLAIRSDGFLRLKDVLARPKLKGIDETTVERLVRDNAKQRFELFWGYDPSLPRPKRPTKGGGKGRGGGGGKGRGGKIHPQAPEAHGKPKGTEGEQREGQGLQQNAKVEKDAAEIDNVRAAIQKTAISTVTEASEAQAPESVHGKGETKSSVAAAPTAPEWVELPLVSVPRPKTDSQIHPSLPSESETPSSTSAAVSSPSPEWFIRATQGHSIALESTSHLELVPDDEEGRRRAGLIVHGTKWELWGVLKNEGLSKMARQHIHLAPALTGPITPRVGSSLLIYLSFQALLNASPPIPLYTSLNGVVLTPGDAEGRVRSEYWEKAVRVETGGKRVVVWENGAEVEREEGQA